MASKLKELRRTTKGSSNSKKGKEDKEVRVRVEEIENGLRIYPAECIKSCKIKTYDDHRVAMSFTLPGLKAEGVEIIDPYCCRKTFENFYEVLEESVY